MTVDDWRVVLDGGLALLLAALVAYVAVLARRMRHCRREFAEMSAALLELAKLVGERNRGAAAPPPAEGIDPVKAEVLRDDLAFLVERGATLADRLEQDLRLGLVRQRQAKRDGASAAGSAEFRGRMVSLPELKLIKTLKSLR